MEQCDVDATRWRTVNDKGRNWAKIARFPSIDIRCSAYHTQTVYVTVVYSTVSAIAPKRVSVSPPRTIYICQVKLIPQIVAIVAMGSGVGSFLLLVGALVAVRPNDVPGLARNAGRALGLSIRAIKRARDAADAAIKKSAVAGGGAVGDNPALKAVTSTVRTSMSHFSSLATSLRKDMTDVPLTPTSFIRSRLQRMAAQHVSIETEQEQQKSNPRLNINAKPAANAMPSGTDAPPTSQSVGSGVASISKTASDFIAFGIQEEALRRQQEKILGRADKDTR